MHLNALEKPPIALKTVFKRLSKLRVHEISEDEEIVDLAILSDKTQDSRVRRIQWQKRSTIEAAFTRYLSPQADGESLNFCNPYNGFAFESTNIPGLLIIPGLLPVDVQTLMLSQLFHRYLSDPCHKTNIDLHHHFDRCLEGQSIFQRNVGDLLSPKDASLHKPVSIKQVLEKKLRWMTLGGQYDWTRKQYPAEEPPLFPVDLKDLLWGLFPATEAQAAIVNLYSPGDTLSLHRDVSEECDRGLVSLSIGCDCVFMIGIENEKIPEATESTILRLHSGDVVLMAGRSRYAWHGVPMIIPDTCPDQLRHWPGTSYSGSGRADDQSAFETWIDWISSKRINLNVRQMRA